MINETMDGSKMILHQCLVGNFVNDGFPMVRSLLVSGKPGYLDK
jgi:hypothetical protein